MKKKIIMLGIVVVGIISLIFMMKSDFTIKPKNIVFEDLEGYADYEKIEPYIIFDYELKKEAEKIVIDILELENDEWISIKDENMKQLEINANSEQQNGYMYLGVDRKTGKYMIQKYNPNRDSVQTGHIIRENMDSEKEYKYVTLNSKKSMNLGDWQTVIVSYEEDEEDSINPKITSDINDLKQLKNPQLVVVKIQ